MKAKITIGEVSIDITEASAADLFEFTKMINTPKPKTKDVVTVTQEAIKAAPSVKKRKTINYLPWEANQLAFIAEKSLEVGFYAPRAAATIAKIVQKQAGNRRSYNTLYAMAYNIHRYLRVGNSGSMSSLAVKTLNDMGYTAAMMRKSETQSNLLGDARRLEVREA